MFKSKESTERRHQAQGTSSLRDSVAMRSVSLYIPHIKLIDRVFSMDHLRLSKFIQMGAERLHSEI